jgi:MerR family transcriptional regulator, light-induced transcriptional regulator
VVNLDEANVCTRADPMISACNEAKLVARTALPNRSATLARVIEADVIPRLLLASGRTNEAPAASSLHVEPQDIDDFARMMIEIDLAKAGIVVSRALAQGVALEAVLLQIFSPTAKRLGEMWTDDTCSFTDVTVGLCALQSLLRSLSSGDIVEPRALTGERILIAAAPGEQHTFGVLMLETFFRRAGWDVVGMPLAMRDELLASVSRKSFGMIGFSLSREDALADLGDLIADVRSASANRGLIVMVGGRVFNDSPELVRAVGADTTASDADEALIASQHLLCSRVQKH